MSWMKGLYRTPTIFIDRGEGPRFFDVDGKGYLDFNVCDLSMTMGYGPEPIVRAVASQVAKGAHFLLPTDDAIEVAELLAARTGLPYWQFTLSASGANTEVLRTARFLTGRPKIILFSGHYHGHLDDTLVELRGDRPVPSLLGIPEDATANTEVLPFNDLEALEAALARRDVALVLTEPALTNCNVVLPQPGYLAEVRELTQRYETLLCLDEAHTFQFDYGGLTGAWQLATDFLVLGKGVGSGVSFGLYGMSAEVAAAFEKHIDVDIGPAGMLGPRSGYCLSQSLPLNYDEASRSLDYELIDTRRVFMANRGIWDAIASAGPQASFVHTNADIDEYLAVAEQFLGEIVAS